MMSSISSNDQAAATADPLAHIMPGVAHSEAQKKKPEEPKAPKKKTIGVKKAHKFMKEVISALQTDTAQSAIKEAKKSAAARGGGQNDLVNAVGTEVEKMVAHVTRKYGFTEGLLQSLASVHAASEKKGGAPIKDALQAVGHMLEL